MKNPLDQLVHELARLPGVGDKTALRLALHILREPAEYATRLSKALTETMSSVGFCKNCQNLAQSELCQICQSQRSTQTICIVEDVADLMSLEKTHAYRGQYHVLHGALSPIDGVGPEQLRIRELIQRVHHLGDELQEIILATNPNVNGDATALYLSKTLKNLGSFKITRLASGIPVGGNIEYIDANTLSKAIERRLEF